MGILTGWAKVRREPRHVVAEEHVGDGLACFKCPDCGHLEEAYSTERGLLLTCSEQRRIMEERHANWWAQTLDFVTKRQMDGDPTVGVYRDEEGMATRVQYGSQSMTREWYGSYGHTPAPCIGPTTEHYRLEPGEQGIGYTPL